MHIQFYSIKKYLYCITKNFFSIFILLAFLIYSLFMSILLGTMAYIFISFSFLLIGFDSDLFHNILHFIMIFLAFYYIIKNLWPYNDTLFNTKK